MPKQHLIEAGGATLTASPAGGHVFRTRLIAGDVLGSSGYYSREVIERDGPKVFPLGTHCYIDHPTETEKWERPERTLRDLAGRINSTPVYESDGLYADVLVHPQWAPVIEALAEDIGMSIRASGTYELGERDGKQVKVITALTAGESVDFVTRAGAGGKITRLIESARSQLAEATMRDTQDALQSALSVRFGTTDEDGPWIWVRDFDDAQVWYSVNDVTYQLGYSLADDGAADLDDGDPIEVNAKTTYVPVSSAGGNTTSTITEESEETPMPKIEVDEAELTQLRANATALAEAQAAAAKEKERADKAEATVAESGARTDATERAKTLLKDVEIAEATKARIVESCTVGLPMGTDEKLDVAAFESRVKARATSEATYEAALLAERGVGRVSGHGEQPLLERADADKAVEVAEAAVAKEFERMGLSESQAKTAAAGRG